MTLVVSYWDKGLKICICSEATVGYLNNKGCNSGPCDAEYQLSFDGLI